MINFTFSVLFAAYQAVMVDPELINRAEKSIRQCLCQLKLLQKVWSEVLPSEVYFKAIGTLFNTCLEEIILRVLSMEDISADAAAHMDSMFSIFLKQGPDIFKVNIKFACNIYFYVNENHCRYVCTTSPPKPLNQFHLINKFVVE